MVKWRETILYNNFKCVLIVGFDAKTAENTILCVYMYTCFFSKCFNSVVNKNSPLTYIPVVQCPAYWLKFQKLYRLVIILSKMHWGMYNIKETCPRTPILSEPNWDKAHVMLIIQNTSSRTLSPPYHLGFR